MPEGPELHLASRFVNKVCSGQVFTGRVVKSLVHKSDEVAFSAKAYTISAASRGKEMQLILTEIAESSPKSNAYGETKRKCDTKPKCRKILFRFGMSGKFEFTPVAEIHKHSHLRFFTADEPAMVLSHVDVRRFGRWEVDGNWSKDRGPDPMFDYSNFRSNVIKNVNKVAFERPICEVLLNQKYFNGIGNYLRAEILFRLRIPPFEKARKVLEGLDAEPPEVKPNVKGQKVKIDDSAVDLLHLCHTVPLEVINLGGGGYDPEGRPADYSKFNAWLQCYYQPGMNNLVDHNKRTIWFQGVAGPMVPKDGKSRSPVKRKKKVTASADEKPPTKRVKAKETGVKPKKNRKTRRSITKQDKSRRSRDRNQTAKPPATKATKVKNPPKRTKMMSCQDAQGGRGYATRSRAKITDKQIPTPQQRTSRK